MAEIETTRADIRALTGVHLYHNYMSNCSQRVSLALREKGVDYVSHHIDLQRQENLTDAFVALNPNKVVPVLVHDGRTYVESNDIIDYIDKAFAGPKLIPDDPLIVALTEELLSASAALQDTIKFLTYEFLMKPISLKSARKNNALEAEEVGSDRHQFLAEFLAPGGFTKDRITTEVAALSAAFDMLEHRLTDTPWLSGATYGLADISWFPNLRRAKMMRYPLERHTALAAWFERASKRASIKASILQTEQLAPRMFMAAYSGYRGLRGTSISAYLGASG
ncbi:glutathione S-transferase family protein [Pararhodobacter oceanensis]|uniref:glutathione S-transferase family protein n=1 Tax=Pararhodobacter oceanensis TaxID=2172121 RepID=UPI003A914043